MLEYTNRQLFQAYHLAHVCNIIIDYDNESSPISKLDANKLSVIHVFSRSLSPSLPESDSICEFFVPRERLSTPLVVAIFCRLCVSFCAAGPDSHLSWEF